MNTRTELVAAKTSTVSDRRRWRAPRRRRRTGRRGRRRSRLARYVASSSHMSPRRSGVSRLLLRCSRRGSRTTVESPKSSSAIGGSGLLTCCVRDRALYWFLELWRSVSISKCRATGIGIELSKYQSID